MPDTALIAATTRFAFKLYSQVVGQNRDVNVFLSPASVALALAMAYNGAGGETRQAIAATLELGALGLEEVNRAGGELLRELEQLDPQVRLAIANSLWVNQDITLEPAFVKRNREVYRAELARLNFADSRSVAVINAWVREHTHGKIERIIEQIDASAILFLINAIYFKGDWTRQFDRKQTRDAPFTLLDGRQKLHPMMHQSGSYFYFEGDGFQAISLPYGGGRLSMYIFLPEQRSSLAAFNRQLSSKRWDSWLQRFRKTEGSIALPRFKLEYDATLNEALKALGMGVAFDPRRADFSAMCAHTAQKVYLNEVRHKTFVEVNEEGTEAAAVTSAGMVLAAFTPSRSFYMVVDRPFFCAIRDNQTGLILFMGSIVAPQ